jgi:hypothetical protein
MRSSNGCWTCKLRRKKCSEHQPVCHACDALNITCHNDQDIRPEWMDNGVKQQEMTEQIKQEIKQKARLRHGTTPISAELMDVVPERSTSSHLSHVGVCQISNLLETPLTTRDERLDHALENQASYFQRNLDPAFCAPDSSPNVTLSQSDIILVTFYLETLLPFLFPFYRPSHLQGGRSWILGLMNRPVVRRAVLCQSSYFLFLTREIGVGRDEAWEKVLTQTSDTFEVLGRALRVIEGSSVAEHLHGAARIQASITQVHRFEIAVLSFRNWQSHLHAGLTLFLQLLGSTAETAGPGSSYNLVMSKLGPSPTSSSSNLNFQYQSAEQAAFHFSSTLLVFDDVIASTVLQTKPRLYEHHANLLGSQCEDSEPPIDVEAVLGINNTILRQISETSALAAWKEQCKNMGNLDVMELVQHASVIKEVLLTQLTRFTFDQTTIPKQASLLNLTAAPTYQRSSVGRVWVHAALIYLSVVISGWQPGNVDVRNNVQQVIELLNTTMSPTLLPTMVWPFCITGCLAEAAQESQFRGMVAALQPSSIFGKVHKALEVMENVWRTRGADHRFASCCLLDGSLILLV